MAFKSKLFQKLAGAVGINLLNHREKISIEEVVPLKEPNTRMHFMELLAMNTKYFSIIQAQKQAMSTLWKLIESFDEEIERWDEIQAAHEKEVDTSKTGPFRKEINDLNQQVNNLKNSIRILEKEKKSNKHIISERDIDRLIQRLDEIHYHQVGQTKAHKRLSMTYNTLYSLLQKLQAHTPDESCG